MIRQTTQVLVNNSYQSTSKGEIKMKIAALFPVSVEPTLEKVGIDLLQQSASPGTEIVAFFDKHKTFAYSGEIETRSVDAIKHAVYAEKNGFDAVLVAAL
jgi:hypothetical protein